jgi:2-oxoglutarate ferredoxin oxidoreductase subunit beta
MANMNIYDLKEKKPYLDYLRLDKLPHIWCPGCGHGIVMKALIEAFYRLKIDKNKLCLASGIGCSSRLPGYIDANTLHTTHGRALAFATGVKLANPELTVVTVTGDGDCTAIGGNHWIHAARRNIDITVILMNNNIYGMTGGQVSPMTPEGAFATTAPYGSIEPNFDTCELAKAAGATFVARSTVYHYKQLIDIIIKALEHKGFSFIEVLSPCPIQFGRKNKLGIQKLYNTLKENTLPIAAWDKLPEEKRKGKLPIGILYHDTSREEYCEKYEKLLDKLAQG